MFFYAIFKYFKKTLNVLKLFLNNSRQVDINYYNLFQAFLGKNNSKPVLVQNLINDVNQFHILISQKTAKIKEL